MSSRIIILDKPRKGENPMAKQLPNVAVLSAEMYTRNDNTVGYRITALTEEQEPRACVFYKDGSDGEPKKGDRYGMELGFDQKLSPKIRFYRI